MSTTYTYAKASKKQTQPQTPQTPSVSTISHRIAESPMGEQVTLASLQEMMIEMQMKMDRQHEETREEVKKADQRNEARMEKIQNVLGKHEKEIIELKEQAGKIEVRQDLTDARVESINRELLEAITTIEMERASCFLRLQNIPEIKESREEDLKGTIADVLASITGKQANEMRPEIHEAYRLSTNYARRHHLPREVHVRFIRKDFRDEIYNYSKENNIVYKEKEIIVLRQTPKRVRDKRREFQFLSTKLVKNNIQFRWLLPEGLLITFMERRYRINTVEEAKHFLTHHLIPEETSEQVEEVERRERSYQGQTLDEQRPQLQIINRNGKEKEREQEGVRTRAQAEAQREGPKGNTT